MHLCFISFFYELSSVLYALRSYLDYIFIKDATKSCLICLPKIRELNDQGEFNIMSEMI